jgi:lipopolysaccharide/colanic/teichoic acid biosynthesis glycosyltransferase
LLIKRLFDVCASSLILLLLAPMFLLFAIWIKVDSPGGVFFRQIRVGRNGQEFRIHKFRTMRSDASGAALQVTVGGDARITRAGAVLRRFKLDELPQFIDVLLGNMSIVGPRPEVPRYMDAYPSDVRRKVLSVRPGITDWASVKFRGESDLLAGAADPERVYIEQILPLKQAYYVRYVDERTFAGDLKIIFATAAAIFRG